MGSIAGNRVEFMRYPRTTEDLELYYNEVEQAYFKLTGIGSAECPAHWQIHKDNILDHLKVQDIFNDLRNQTEIPYEEFIKMENQIKEWIKRRMIQHILHTSFKMLLKRIDKKQRYNDPYFIAALGDKDPELEVKWDNYYPNTP